MKISTTRFGDLEITDRDIMTFAGGIVGFENLSRFIIVDASDDSLVMWLQSVDDGVLAFPIIEPRVFNPDYGFKPSPIDLKDLDLENLGEADVYTVLTIPQDVREMSANLKAPLIINRVKRVGKQVVLQNNKWSIRHPVYTALKSHMLAIVNTDTAKLQLDKGSDRNYSPRAEKTL